MTLGTLRYSGCPLERYDWQVVPSTVEADFQRQPGTGLASHQCVWPGTRRTARPTRARLKSRLPVGGMRSVVHFIWRLSAQPRVRTTSIVPVRNGRKLPMEGVAAVRNQQEASQEAFHRQDETFYD